MGRRSRERLATGPVPSEKQPPTAGAIDLGALRGGPTPEQKKQIRDQILQQQGLLCQCGERVRDEGVVVVSVAEGLIPTEQGPQPGVQLSAVTLHSRSCPLFAEMVKTALCVRDQTPIQWLDETDDKASDQEQLEPTSSVITYEGGK